MPYRTAMASANCFDRGGSWPAVQPCDQDEHPDHVHDPSGGHPAQEVVRQVQGHEEDRTQGRHGQATDLLLSIPRWWE